ncbi:branched-chain amino acid transport system substrate-binding protein [Actinomadura luteofluorescens]|uniref:Branched-chain amino acid transport system substrate-binding protein n=1 Tax=Actinomadura luteofluorescens TaxID=46163 RepID=A0A7Y9ERK5_9ACTN|nr:branched-chain amino acid ABC transporter substrate-binding protein [Actinomadura luteofluorescens]NYD52649.1 branched-chain amino acid transport system substrate-binding protein [Actinomadura luteofluorescens]
MTPLTPRDRGRRFRMLTAAGAGLLLVPLAAACGSGGSGGSGAIKIGVPAPLSGDSASAGQDILAAAKVAADEINKAGGVDGRKIQIVEADDQCSAQQGAQAAQKLLNSGVVAVAGGYCSGAAVPAIPIYGRRGVPFVMDASTNPSLTDSGKGKVFRTCGRDDNQGLVAARFMTGPLGAKRIALLHDNTTYAKGLADAAANSARQAGGQVVYENALQPGQSDYGPVLTKIASTRPDVLYFTGYFAEAGLLMKQRKQLGLRFTLMGGDATTDSTVLKTAGAAAGGYIATTAPLAKDLPAAAAFVSAYKAANHADPGPFSVYEYDAVKVVAKAIDDAGSTRGAAITEALHKIKGFPGITGPITFDAKGDRTDPLYITVQVQGGAFTAYKKLDESGATWVDAKTS